MLQKISIVTVLLTEDERGEVTCAIATAGAETP
jgi:hypothetical protein